MRSRSKWKVCCTSTMIAQLIGTKYVQICEAVWAQSRTRSTTHIRDGRSRTHRHESYVRRGQKAGLCLYTCTNMCGICMRHTSIERNPCMALFHNLLCKCHALFRILPLALVLTAPLVLCGTNKHPAMRITPYIDYFPCFEFVAFWSYWMFYDHFSVRSLLAKLGRWGWWRGWGWLERKARRH